MERKVKLNFQWCFLQTCVPLGSVQDWWQWPRKEEANLSFSWGFEPLLWMAGVNTSNQQQMFGFLAWPCPYPGSVGNPVPDSASMPKQPGSTLLALSWVSSAAFKILHWSQATSQASQFLFHTNSGISTLECNWYHLMLRFKDELSSSVASSAPQIFFKISFFDLTSR